MIVHWYIETFICDKAVKKSDSVELYDEHDNLIQKIENVGIHEWEHISLENGEWIDEFEIPTETEKIRADLDYCLMLLEDL